LTDFVALYRGRTVAEAELVAVSAESTLVRKLFAELIGESEHKPNDIQRNARKGSQGCAG
jgi:hypothetical protein